MDKNRRLCLKGLLAAAATASVAPTRLLAQESSSIVELPSYKLGLSPVSSQVPAANLADLKRIRMDAIIDPTNARIIGGDIDKLTVPVASASLNKQPAFMVIEDFLEAGKTYEGKPLSLETKLPDILVDVVKPNGKILRNQRYIFSDLTLEEGLKYIIVASKNKILSSVIKLVAGDEETFVALMNAKARELGMGNTCFINACGLPGDEDFILRGNNGLSNVTTMEDWAKLVVAMERRYPDYKKYSQMRSLEIPRNIGGRASIDRFRSTSALLSDREYRQRVTDLGLQEVSPKTGTTDLGRVEVDTAILDGKSLAVMTFGHPHLVNENYLEDNEPRRYVEEKDRPEAILKSFQEGHRLLSLEEERKNNNKPKRDRDPLDRHGPRMIA